MAHGDAREGNWRGNWWMDWVASTLHTTSEHGVSSITTIDAHTSAVICRLNWSPRRFKWTRPFRRKTKYGFCSCAITFQTQFTWLPSPNGNAREDKSPIILCLLQYTRTVIWYWQYETVLWFYFKVTKFGAAVVRISGDTTLKQYFETWDWRNNTKIKRITIGLAVEQQKVLKFTYEIFNLNAWRQKY